MCQIIALKTTAGQFKKLRKNLGMVDVIQELLAEKGGDYYSAGILVEDSQYIIRAGEGVEDIFNDVKDFLKLKEIKKSQNMQLLLFSRQQPEMEMGEVQDQPYHHKTAKKLIFAVHGTISNDKELAEEYGVEIAADTEILQHMPVEEWHKAEGSFTVIGTSQFGMPVIYDHGLKTWTSTVQCCDGEAMFMTATCDLSELDPSHIQLGPTPGFTDKTLFAAFSGGMDIALSTYNALATGMYTKAVLNYFAWGSKAEESEIDSLDKFYDFYTSEFPEVDIEIKIVEAEYYFEEYFKINGAQLPKISSLHKDSSGEEGETESPLAYVPYRNTQFTLLLASKAEAMNLKDVDICLGLNLSEGMVYMDNSEGWLRTVGDMVRLGGKDPSVTKTYDVIAPYFPRTKTNMLQEFQREFSSATLEQLLDCSYSCYYPGPDGKPCGECGSCILREKALDKKDA